MKGCRPSTPCRSASGRPGSAGIAGARASAPAVRVPSSSAQRPGRMHPYSIRIRMSWSSSPAGPDRRTCGPSGGGRIHRSSWPVGGRRRSRPVLVRTDGRDRPPGGREHASAWLARSGRVPPLTPLSLRSSPRASSALPRAVPADRLGGLPRPFRALGRARRPAAPGPAAGPRRRGFRVGHPPRQEEMGELGELPRHRHPGLPGCLPVAGLHPLEERLHPRALLHRAVHGLEQDPPEEPVRVRPGVLAEVLARGSGPPDVRTFRVGGLVVERKDAGVGRERPARQRRTTVGR